MPSSHVEKLPERRGTCMSLTLTAPNKRPWRKRVGGAITAVLLGAVPVLALTTLSPRLFATPQPGKTEADAGVSTGPFTFDAPTLTLNRHKAGEQPSAPGEKDGSAREDSVLLTDWKYTLTDQ